MRSKLKSMKEHIYTLLLIPPDASLYHAMEPLRRDLAELQKGVNFDMLVEGKVTKICVAGAISILVGDHSQACDNTHHLGKRALKNFRSCHVHIEDRTIWDIEILDHSMTRRRRQTDVIVSQLKKEMNLPHLSATAKKILFTKYGIRLASCTFAGLIVDPHLQ